MPLLHLRPRLAFAPTLIFQRSPLQQQLGVCSIAPQIPLLPVAKNRFSTLLRPTATAVMPPTARKFAKGRNVSSSSAAADKKRKRAAEEDEEEVDTTTTVGVKDLGKMKKDADGNPYWQIGGKDRRVSLTTFRGSRFVNIREYYQKDGQSLPGKKGIGLNIDQMNNFILILPKITEMLEKEGIEVARPVYSDASGASKDVEEDDDVEEDVKEDEKEDEDEVKEKEEEQDEDEEPVAKKKKGKTKEESDED